MTARLAALALAALLGGCAGAAGPTTSAFDGSYSGEGFIVENPGGGCPLSTPTSVMTVSGGEVRFGSFFGRVAPDGTVQMSYRQTWISGQFAPGVFHGRVWTPPQGCTYRLDMPRA